MPNITENIRVSHALKSALRESAASAGESMSSYCAHAINHMRDAELTNAPDEERLHIERETYRHIMAAAEREVQRRGGGRRQATLIVRGALWRLVRG